MIRSVIAANKNSYKPWCKQESDILWCWGKLLTSIKREINNRISFKHLYHSYLSAFFISAGVPDGEFAEILIAKCRSRFYCTWFFCSLSPAWTGSPARETLISRTQLFLPHDLPPNKKIKYNKILTYILRSIFLQIPHLELPRSQTSHNDSIGDEFIARLIEIRSFPWHQRLSNSCLHNGL
jgi:hypothetical protein